MRCSCTTEKCENQKPFSCLMAPHTLSYPHILSTLVPVSGNMEKEGMLVRSIYYGSIGSEATEMLLEKFGDEGSFLLRDSETVQGALCLCVRKALFVHTYRLVQYTDGWCFQNSEVSRQRFQTLETLIESYRRGVASGVSAVAPLRNPLDKTQIQSISLRQGLVYMETCNSSGC